MKDKERLEQIKTTKYTFLETSKTDLKGDFAWLINQAERVETISDHNAQQTIYIHHLKQQNQKYREALEYIATFESPESAAQYLQRRAAETLESETNE